MILVDANLLVYAFMEGVPQHSAARGWVEQTFNSVERVGLPWASLLAFVRIASNPRIFQHPAEIGAAWSQVEEWLDLAPSWIPEPTPRHREVLTNLLPACGTDPNLVPDAHLAALAIEHDLLLYTSDRDFACFSGLRWENPLARPKAG